MLGIIAAGTWGTERIVAVKPGQSVSLSGYDLTFEGLSEQPGPNYSAIVANFTVREGGVVVGTLRPEKRSFAARESSNERGGADDARRKPALPVAWRQ